MNEIDKQPVSSGMAAFQPLILDAEERALVLAHREAKRKRVEEIRAGINEAVSAALQGYFPQTWEDWPGTNRIANSVLNHLQTAGLLKL